MNKRFVSFGSMMALVTILLSLVLSACGGSGSTGKVTVTWLVRTTDPGLTKWEEQTVKDFEKENPTIHVELIKVPNTSYDQKILTTASGGNPIDIFSQWGQNSWTDFAYRGLAADLAPYVKSSNFNLDDMDQSLLDQYKVNGKLYAIPFSTGGSYLFYNVDLLKKANLPTPPTSWDDPTWTWDKVLQYAQAMTVKSDDAAKRQFGYMNDLWPQNSYARLFGGDIFTENAYKTGVIDGFHANSPEVLQSIQWQQDLMYKYQVSPSPAQSSALSNGFMSGKVGMTVTGVWGFWVNKVAPFKWGVAPLPKIATNNNYFFTDPWMMAKTSKHPQEAWTFLKYLVDPQKGGKSYSLASGAPSPWKSLATVWAQNAHDNFVSSLSTEQLTELYKGSLKYGRESINHIAIGYGQYDSVIGNVLAPVFNGKKDAKDGVNDLQKQLEDTLSRNGGIKPLQ